MTHYVVDASVAAKWFIQEIHTEEARRLLANAHQLSAPDLLWLELHSVVCRRIRRKQLQREHGLAILAALRAFPIQVFPSAELLDRATSIALDTAGSLYDCLYLALAVFLDARVVTADRRFHRALAESNLANRVLWIGDIL